MRDNETNDSVSAVPRGVGDAVGVPDARWYVAIVTNNTERASADRLARLGHEAYVAVQEEMRMWRNGRRKLVARVVLPSLVFVRCTERERLEIVKLPFINRFMTNRAGLSTSGHSPLATIPDEQLESLKFMLGQSDAPVSIISTPLRHGDKVTVTRGSLAGLRGEVIDVEGDRGRLLVSLGPLGHATLQIDTINLAPDR